MTGRLSLFIIITMNNIIIIIINLLLLLRVYLVAIEWYSAEAQR